MYFKGK